MNAEEQVRLVRITLVQINSICEKTFSPESKVTTSREVLSYVHGLVVATLNQLEETQVCSHCGQKGHLRADCKQFKAWINGWGRI